MFIFLSTNQQICKSVIGNDNYFQLTVDNDFLLAIIKIVSSNDNDFQYQILCAEV